MESKYSNNEFNLWAFGFERAYRDHRKAFAYWIKNHSDLYKPHGSNKIMDDIKIMYELWAKKKN